jgi:hypothetical protein
MTRIDEMDEFFNFEDATNPALALDGGLRGPSPRHPPSSSLYDIDLILAQAADDDDSFNSLQHFDIDPPADASQYASSNLGDVHMGEADHFDHYPHWINGAERPPKPCVYCGSHKQHRAAGECFDDDLDSNLHYLDNTALQCRVTP